MYVVESIGNLQRIGGNSVFCFQFSFFVRLLSRPVECFESSPDTFGFPSLLSIDLQK